MYSSIYLIVYISQCQPEYPLKNTLLENDRMYGINGPQHLKVLEIPIKWDGEGNGNPLQRSCLENPRDGGAWWAAVYGVSLSRTRLKWLSSSSSSSSSSSISESLTFIWDSSMMILFRPCWGKNSMKNVL